MSSLNIPQQQQTAGKTITRSGSASSLRPAIEHVDDLAPMSRSRRNSESNAAPLAGPAPASTSAHPASAQSGAQPSSSADSTSTPSAVSAFSAGAPHSAAARAGLIPLPSGPIQSKAENEALVDPVDWQLPDHLKASNQQSASGQSHATGAQTTGQQALHLNTNAPQSTVTTIYVGKDKKEFRIDTAQLREKSPYFKKLLAEDTGHAGKIASAEQTAFEDLDEVSMVLFVHWLSQGDRLAGPHDFHSLAHYLGLYVLAKKFEIESLQNQVMDLVRHYYAEQNMTAPSYRLEYIYTFTHTPNHMRTFLISTAAFRALEEAPRSDINSALQHAHTAQGPYVSESLKAVLAKDPEIASDFIEQLIKLHKDGEHDARHGVDCLWHDHEYTPKCAIQRIEPWQKDGAADEKPPADKPADAPKDDKPKEDKPKEDKPKDDKPKDDPKDKEPKDKKPDEPKDKKPDELKKPEEKKAEPPKPSPGPAGPSAPVPLEVKKPEAPKPVVPASAAIAVPPGAVRPVTEAIPAAPAFKALAVPTPADGGGKTPPKTPGIAQPVAPKPVEAMKADVHKPQVDESKNDDNLFKGWGSKVKGHFHEFKDKLHKPASPTPPATPPAAPPAAPMK